MRGVDREPGEVGGSSRLRHAQDAHQEQERGDDLEEEGGHHVVLPEVPGAPAVLAEPARPAGGLAVDSVPVTFDIVRPGESLIEGAIGAPTAAQ